MVSDKGNLVTGVSSSAADMNSCHKLFAVSDLVQFFDYIEKTPDEVIRKDFSQYVKYLARKELTPSTITRKIASIKGFFRFLCHKRYIQENPSSSINSPKLPKI